MRAALFSVVVIASCGGGKAVQQPSAPTPEPPAPMRPPDPPKAGPMTLAQSGIVPDWIDRSADPCSDFFQYACGKFVATAVIPPDRSAWGAAWIVQEDAEAVQRDVLEKSARQQGNKVGDYYTACMDEAAIETAGTVPIAPLLETIASVKDAASARKAVIELSAATIDPFFVFYPVQDYADATKMIGAFDQAGLGLPDRDYYFSSAGNIKAVRTTYKEHIGRMLVLAGGSAASAADVLRIETAIAKVHQDKVVRRNPRKIYNKIDLAGVMKVAPTFPWKDYLAAMGVPDVTAITVNDPRTLAGVIKVLDREKPAAIRAYLTARLMDHVAPLLGKAFVDEDHVMARAIQGVKEVPPRWRRCVDGADRDLGQLLGKEYVAQRFAGDAKARATDLTKAVLAAMGAELDVLPWMDAETRTAAKHKLEKMGYLVGYPDAWRSYDFAVSRESHAKNVIAAWRFEQARQLAKIGKPVDRTDWQMTPQTVNAYFDPTLNQMVLPAGQMQPPFFGATFHPAVNFGGTGGSTIGHEMTHGFDDEGSQFDADGNLRDWWSKQTKAKFEDAGQCVVEQYGKYDAVPGVKINGKLTAGENIADIGGVKLGFQAYQAWRAAQKTPPPAEVEGLSDDQLYFLAYAQSWCAKVTPESEESRAHSDPHSPPRWRVNGVIVDQPAFGGSWKCKAGTPMVPEKSCSVW